MLNQNDYILRQVNQLTQVLTRILSVLTGLKGKSKAGYAYEMTNKALNEELEWNLEDLLKLSPEAILTKLEDEKAFNHENLEYLADIFYNLALHQNSTETEGQSVHRLMERSLAIYQHIEQSGTVYSIDRNHKMDHIRQLMDTNNN